MARISCRWRNFFICLCTPCLLLLLLFIYVTVMTTMAMNGHVTEDSQSEQAWEDQVIPSFKRPPPDPRDLFVAPGIVRSKRFASTPRVFWEKKENVGFWNQLQRAVDLQFNPILGPQSSQTHTETHTEGLYSESWLRPSLSKVKDSDLVKLPEHLRNYVRPMNRRHYPVLIEPRGQCGAGATDERGPALLLLVIKTSADHYEHRQAVRQSWGQAGWVKAHSNNSRGAYVRRVFVLGTPSSLDIHTVSSQLLSLETRHYGDILQWDCWDTLLNETVRELLFWTWFKDTCGQTYFVLEADDLAFVNTGALVDLLMEQLQSNSSLEDFMTGNVVLGERSDSMISESIYKGLYPSYTSGGRLYSGLLLRRLQQVSKRVHVFPMEEVYVGMCLIRLNLSPTHHPAFISSELTTEEEEEPCVYHRLLLVHTHSPTHMLTVWTHVSSPHHQLSCRESEVTTEPVQQVESARLELDKMHF